MTYTSEVTADAPLYRLTFDQSGSTITDTGSSPRTITQFGSPPKVSGISGTGLSFSGSNTQYITAASVYDFGSDTSYSIEVWFKSSQTTGLGTFLRRDSGGAVLLRLNAGKVEFYCNNGTMATSPLSYADGNWHHAVAVRTGSTTTVLYVDGAQVATGAATTHTQTTSVTTYIGTNNGAGDEVFAGTMDELAFYNTALSSTRVGVHYTEGVAEMANETIAVPAMTLSVTAPAPVVTAVDVYAQTITTNGDRATGTYRDSFPNETGIYLGSVADSNTSKKILFKFDGYIPMSGNPVIDSALLTVYNGNSTAVTVRVQRITSSWDELTAGEPSVVTTSHTGIVIAGSTSTTINISEVISAWNSGSSNYGIAIDATSGGDALIRTLQHSTVGERPKITVAMTPAPAVHVEVEVPAMSLSVTAPDVTHKHGVKQSVPAASLSLSAVVPTVTAQRHISVAAPPMVLNLTFPGGNEVNPDYLAEVPLIEMWLTTPNVNGFGGTDASNEVPPMELDVEAVAPVLDLVTGRTVYVPPMNLTINMVGMYDPEADRYHNMLPGTIDAEDIWYKMEELDGVIAVDAITNEDTAVYSEDGDYIGSPTFQVEGPELRKAVGFDGVDDAVLVTGPYPNTVFSDMDATLEFSIKTTDLSGTLIRGGGNAGGQSGTGMYGGTGDSEVRLVDGELAIYTGSGQNLLYRTRKFIADGQWHHIVISLPSATAFIFDAYNISAAKPFFVMVDGKTEWTRYAPPLFGRSLLPTGIMARATFNSGATDATLPQNYTFSQHVDGDMRDFLVRLHYAVSQNTAAKLYYEWSNSLLLQPNAMELSLAAVDPFEAKGNVKRMLALYGLPYYLREGNEAATRDGYGTYYSVFAGYFIRTDANFVPTGPGGSFQPTQTYSNTIRMSFYQVKPFMLEGYLVYPLAIANTPGSTGTTSAPGIENGEYRDPITKNYTDNQTGLPRFVDLQLDLSEDVTDFDAITAVNYPARLPDDGVNVDNPDQLREPRQHNLGLNNGEWQSARDDLRDSILDAAYNGVNLWITEPHMAEHLGFIQAYDKHETGARVEFFGAGNIESTGYTNKKAEQLDDEHLDENVAGGNHRVAQVGIGQFNYTWQANAYRQIVSTEPGLTNRPSYEYADTIHWRGDAAWELHNDVYAYDVIDRTGGLQIGDKLRMDMWEQDDYTGNYPAFNGWSVGDPRKWIVSAKPEGVVGKIISKEQDFYYGPNAVVRANPWKDNVYTIVAERGTVVRGGAIAGRAFIEFMDPDIARVKIPEDKDKSMWNGDVGRNVSTWDLDTRRYRHIVVVNVVERVVTRGADQIAFNDEVRYVDIQDAELNYLPHMSMNARGLNWLKESGELEPGTAKAYVNPMQLTLNMNNVTMSKTRNITSTVIGSARIDIDMRRPRGFEDGEVTEKALPMVLDLSFRGLGKNIQVPVIELDLTTPDVKVTGDGDSIFVYMDASRNVTVFLKED